MSAIDCESVLIKHNFKYKKAFGQNFIFDADLLDEIAVAGGADKNTVVVEIGAGAGTLSRAIAKRCKTLCSFEIDETLFPVLSETLEEFDNVKLFSNDVTAIGIETVDMLIGEPYIVIANLPYYITSPVIMRLLEERLPIRSLTVMVQREAADRICARVGTRECGAVTVAVNYYSTPKKLFNVSRGSFAPSPNVDSAVIRLDVADTPKYDVKDEKLFFRIVRTAFSQRRKQMINPLSAELGISKSETAELLERSGVKATARAEEVSMEGFVKLCASAGKLKI